MITVLFTVLAAFGAGDVPPCAPLIWSDHAMPSFAGTGDFVAHPDMWERLIADGWHSRQDDGMEAIYPPLCP